MVMLRDGARAKNVYDELPIMDISKYLQGSLAADETANNGSTAGADVRRADTGAQGRRPRSRPPGR